MSWFRWKGKQEPWGDNFSIVTVTLADTAIGQPKIYTVPFDQHLQLIGCGIELNPGILPSTLWCYVYAQRGGELLHYCLTPLQGPVIGISTCWLGVTLIRWQDRNAIPRATAPLPDHFYVYPHDQLIIDAAFSGGGNASLLHCTFTFKQWITS